jgi:hypothetical protein
VILAEARLGGAGREAIESALSLLVGSAPVVNPLTGILGNAELLLEARRGTLDLPLQTLQRLETIAELAVHIRETVRRLTDGKRQVRAALKAT